MAVCIQKTLKYTRKKQTMRLFLSRRLSLSPAIRKILNRRVRFKLCLPFNFRIFRGGTFTVSLTAAQYKHISSIFLKKQTILLYYSCLYNLVRVLCLVRLSRT